jgi:two-component system sensor histidine kinase YesM
MALKSKQKDLALQIQALSNHFKHSLNQGKEMTTVGEEVKHLQDYLTIQKNRFGDVLNTNIKVDKDVENIPVLNLILQPLVENSIVHGLENKLGDWLIEVSVWKEAGNLYYQVEDNGMGVDEKVIQSEIVGNDQSNEALALRNINKRIQYKYGNAYKIDFYSQIGEGTKVVIIIPIEGGD